jgi:hypothetical protein
VSFSVDYSLSNDSSVDSYREIYFYFAFGYVMDLFSFDHETLIEVDHVIDEVDNEAKTGLHHVTSIEHENKVKRDQKTTGIISLDQGHVTETSKVISHTAREIDIVIRLGRRLFLSLIYESLYPNAVHV